MSINPHPAAVARPGDPAYTAATRVFNLAAPAEPMVALTARSVADVQAALRYAEAEKLSVRVHATGHGAAAGSPMDGALLIRTELAGGVEVDADRRVARVPAGTRWREVVEAAAPYGLAAAHGSAGTVGVVGYLLRGGLSLYGRLHGLAVNTVRAVDVVTADGTVRRVDADHDAELFWALRGGGGGFGVVTAVEIALFPAHRVITGATYWSARHAADLLARWRDWTLTAPPEATTSVRLLSLPPDVPPPLNAGPMLVVDGAVLAPGPTDVSAARDVVEALLAPLRAVAEPILDAWQESGPGDVLAAHLEPTEPLPVIGDHLLLHDLGDQGLRRFLAVTGEGSGSPLVVAGLRQLGGAYARRPAAGGALAHVTAAYSYAGSAAPFAATPEEIRAHCDTVRVALTPWDTGRTVPSFVEHVGAPQGHLDTAAVAAVDRVRSRVDPEGRFRDDVTPHATELR
ncbi:FAD-binding oxidoreductase [Micromonospora sp. NPDC051543]|uniref:FAD-binding oxidoreductase n=1 Tax=Micromonospora sp. NPDC051543 TaxID=3364287 RepID=UPI0037A4B055